MVDEAPDDAIRNVEHTADWAIRIRGRDLTELFDRAAAGMVRLLVADPSTVPLDVERSLSLESYDAEGLLVEWLGELAYLAESDGLIFTKIKLDRVTPTRLTGTMRGGRAPELLKHIKAVTYHELAIRQIGSELEVTVVFDV
jgi:SHS2 domain-containing protein